jgi:hypothetical protein
MLALDPAAIHDLCESRVACNEALAGHPTVQVQETDSARYVGILGVLNGIFDDGARRICAHYDRNVVVGFSVVNY